MAAEVCKRNHVPFASPQTLYRRLDKLCKAGLLYREKCRWNGEYYFYLSKEGKALVELETGEVLPRKAYTPISPTLLGHELDLTKFWIKFLDDAQKLNLPIVQFWRDGQFVFHSHDGKLIPDGTIILRIKGKHHVCFVEMDRSKQSSGIRGSAKAVIRQKLQRYAELERRLKQHPALSPFRVSKMKVVFVCLTEQRLQNLLRVAEQLDVECGFTCWPRIVHVKHPDTAQGWQYRKANLLAAELFSFSSRAPPKGLLSAYRSH